MIRKPGSNDGIPEKSGNRRKSLWLLVRLLILFVYTCIILLVNLIEVGFSFASKQLFEIHPDILHRVVRIWLSVEYPLRKRSKKKQRLLQTIDAPMSLRKFPSGACVLQLNSNRDEEIAKSTRQMLEENGFLTPVKLSQIANVSVLLARERLFTTERLGLACRDESIEGLAFYPNLFLEKV